MLAHLPFAAPLAEYERQAGDLLAAWAAGDPAAIELIHRRHPRFLNAEIPWLPLDIPDSEIAAAPFDQGDARLTIARYYDFLDWAALADYAKAVDQDGSDVYAFESAVDAVIHGDAVGLRRMLAGRPDLARARSARVTHFDPPLHGAYLLHYLVANGVENYRQKTPPNAVEIGRILLEAGADPDALADLYGERCTVMSMLVSSHHPALAGVQCALVGLLVDFGASVEAVGPGKWSSPVFTALIFGYPDAAEALIRRGARVVDLPVAAGLGRTDRAAELLPGADAEERHRALAIAAQLGRTEVVRLLLDAGEDPNRFNPEGTHKHSTPLHQAAHGGHLAVVRLLVERGARVDIEDSSYRATPLGWAVHGGRTEVADYLRGL